MKPHAFVVFNPVAGQGDPQETRRALEQHLDQAGWNYELYQTTGQERIAGIVQQALSREFAYLVAVGGDGTASGVAGGLVNTDTPMAIIPTGTGNALARDLEIPLNCEEALNLLIGDHTTKAIDAMQVGERCFFLNVSVGISSRMMRDTERSSKQQFGRLAYAWAGVVKLLGLRLHRFEVKVDDQAYRVRASEVMVLNSGALGAPYLSLDQQIHLNDGTLNVYIVRARTLPDYLRLMGNALLRREKPDPGLKRLYARKRISISTRRPLPVQADGDVIGQAPVEIRVVPKAVQVVVPREKNADSPLASVIQPFQQQP